MNFAIGAVKSFDHLDITAAFALLVIVDSLS